MFTILGRDASLSPNPQSIWMQADIDALAAAYAGWGVYSGCQVTPNSPEDLDVLVSAGHIAVGGGRGVLVVADTLTIAAPDTTDPRVDLIVVSNTGVLDVVVGTPAPIVGTFPPDGPSPAGIPSNHVLLAMVFVPANETEITAAHITDKRVFGKWPQIIEKTAQETVASSTVLQDDDELAFTAGAGEKWHYEQIVYPTSGSNTPDIKTSWTVPSGAVMTWGAWGLGTGATSGATSSAVARLADLSEIPFGAIAAAYPLVLSGLVTMNTTPGLVQFQWAQNTSNATATAVNAGSRLIATPAW